MTSSHLYQDTTFSQLSRTVTSHTQHRLESPASHHRLALVLNCIDFELETVTSAGWELFDEAQVAAVLEQCELGALAASRPMPDEEARSILSRSARRWASPRRSAGHGLGCYTGRLLPCPVTHMQAEQNNLTNQGVL